MNLSKRAAIAFCAATLAAPLVAAGPAPAATKLVTLSLYKYQFVSAFFSTREGCVVTDYDFTASKFDYKSGRGGMVHDRIGLLVISKEDTCRGTGTIAVGGGTFNLKMRSDRVATLTGTATVVGNEESPESHAYKLRLEFRPSEPFTLFKEHTNVVAPEGHLLLRIRGMDAGATVRGSLIDTAAPNTNLIASVTGWGEMARSIAGTVEHTRT